MVAAFIGAGVAMAIPDTPTYHKEVLYLGALMVFLATESFGYYVHFNTRGGKFVILNGVDGLHELVLWMRERNPALQVRGM
jgi:hypothetical protein